MSDRIDVSAQITVNDQATAQIGRVRTALGGIGDAAKKVGDAAQSLGQKFRDSFAQAASWKGLQSSLSTLGSAFSRIRSSVMSVLKPLGALFGIGGGLGLAQAVSGLESYVASVRTLGRESQVLGATVEQLSGLQFAASRVGISAESMSGALSRANINIGRAAAGKGNNLTAMMRKLGISMRDAQGGMRSTADLMPELADAFARQTNAVTRARMANELFGRAAGPEMLKLLNQGAPGIEKAIALGREMGLVIGPEQLEAANKFGAAQSKVRLQFRALSQQLYQNFLPILTPLVTKFGELFDKLRPAIVRELTSAMEGLATWLQEVDWEGNLKGIRDWARWIKEVIESTVGWKGALGAVAVFMAGPMIASLLTIAATIAANPILAALFGVGAAGVFLWQKWNAGAFHQAFAEMDQGTKQLGEQMKQNMSAEGIAADWEEQTGRLRSAFARLRAWFGGGDAVEAPEIAAPFAGIGPWFGERAAEIKAAFGALPEFFRDSIWGPIKQAFADAQAFIEDIIRKIVAAIDGLLGKLPSLAGIGETFGGIARTVWNAPGNAVDWIAGRAGLRNEPSVIGAAQQSIVGPATAAQAPARVDGEVGVNVHFANAPPGTTVETTERERVRAEADVGLSMAAPA